MVLLYGIIAIVVHEWAHAFAAVRCGDMTALPRMTLNPFAHIDWLWTLLIPLFVFVATHGAAIFGMGRPVFVNYVKLSPTRRRIVAGAGIFANLLLALAFFRVLPVFAKINLSIALFNLLPIPPAFDGYRLLRG